MANSAPPVAARQLVDNLGRSITYLRLGVTDRCNLRCRYCRPEKGVPFIPHREILSFEELERLAAVFCTLGITKVRVTGGEPFARKDCLSFLQRLRNIPGLDHLHITTNGVATGQYLDELVGLRLAGINLSLDTLDQQRFWRITRRDYFDRVMLTFNGILALQLPLKINSVVLNDTEDLDFISLADFARQFPVTVRFIEMMPFSGASRPGNLMNGNLLQRLQRLFPGLAEEEQSVPSTARIFSVPEYKGKIGIIEGYSRHFCATCNKVRVTPVGMLKTCLYDNGVLDLKRMLRTGADDDEVRGAVINCVGKRCADGHEAERLARRSGEPSMSSIGG
jgi:cyclic pyranopterin phosphate synthase